MTTLSNAHPAAHHVAMQDQLSQLFRGISNLLASFSRAVAFSRQCEAEFSRQGRVSPDVLKKLMTEV